MAFAEHGLGKSLSDVFARTPRKDAGKGFLEVDLASISPTKENPRQHFDQGSLDELAQSIRLHGVLQPIVVRRRDQGFEIISGERRFRAARLAGLTKIPVVIRDDGDAQRVTELRLIENIQREDLNPIELAQAYRTLLEQYGLTHENLAERVAKDRSSITNTLRLLSLPASLQSEVAAGTLSLGHAKALLGATDPAWVLAIARRAIEEHLSVREVERLAKERPPTADAKTSAQSRPAPHIRELEDNLYRLFGSRVQVKERGSKGSLTLHFDGKEQFQRLVSILERLVKQSNAGT